jgi:hypothetical protein
MGEKIHQALLSQFSLQEFIIGKVPKSFFHLANLIPNGWTDWLFTNEKNIFYSII